MGAFIYKAVDGAGKPAFGEISAATLDLAMDQLSRQGLVPVSLDVRKPGFWARINEPIEMRRKVGLATLCTLTRSLARLLSAGVTVERTLRIMIESLPAGSERALIERLMQGVQGGESLAGTMAREGDVFPLYYVNMVRAGELSGSLDATFARLSTLLDRTLRFRREILSALIYPAILLLLIAVTLIVVVTVVLPEFELIFASAGMELPLPTKIVMAIGNFVTSWWWAMAIVLVGATAGAVSALRQPAMRLKADRAFLKARLIGSLAARVDLVRFFRTLGTMLDQGVPLDDGWAIAARVPKNTALRADLGGLLGPLKEGVRITQALSALGYVPAVARQLVSVGEETGGLASAMIEVAGILEEEQELIIKRLLNIFTPAVTLILGGIVAAFVGSVLLGILSINDLAI